MLTQGGDINETSGKKFLESLNDESIVVLVEYLQSIQSEMVKPSHFQVVAVAEKEEAIE